MASSRPLSWSSALRDLKADRVVVPSGFAGARAMAQTYSCTRNLPLVVAGRFDRRAIMACAVLAAKAHQRRYGSTWAEALSVSLKATWQLAKAARPRTAH
ncbi:hypothetical protein [Methylobacterium sp. A54F]